MPKFVTISVKIYRRLLVFYPAAYRHEYGEPMLQLFRDQCREAWRSGHPWRLVVFWLRILSDLAGTSFAERARQDPPASARVISFNTGRTIYYRGKNVDPQRSIPYTRAQ